MSLTIKRSQKCLHLTVWWSSWINKWDKLLSLFHVLCPSLQAIRNELEDKEWPCDSWTRINLWLISMHSFTQKCIPWVVIWVTKSFHRQIIGTNQLWQRLCKAQKIFQHVVVCAHLASPESEKNWKVSQWSERTWCADQAFVFGCVLVFDGEFCLRWLIASARLTCLDWRHQKSSIWKSVPRTASDNDVKYMLFHCDSELR